jgi:hypothetical protein
MVIDKSKKGDRPYTYKIDVPELEKIINWC